MSVPSNRSNLGHAHHPALDPLALVWRTAEEIFRGIYIEATGAAIDIIVFGVVLALSIYWRIAVANAPWILPDKKN